MDGSERATRYFEAVHAAWFKRMEAKVVSTPEEHSEALALAAMAVADAERDEARAEVERLRRRLVRMTHIARYQRDKVAAAEALAEKFDRFDANGGTIYKTAHVVDQIRAALASVGRTDPATPAPFTRYSGTAGSKVDAALGPQGEAAEHGGTVPLSTKDTK